MIDILHGDNLPILQSMDDASFDLVYIDPPFNTGKPRTHTTLRTVRTFDGPGLRCDGPDLRCDGASLRPRWVGAGFALCGLAAAAR